MANKDILTKSSLEFLEKYLNNPSPTGYEWEGQKIWMEYLKPYVDEFITDTYGTAVGVINPKSNFDQIWKIGRPERSEKTPTWCPDILPTRQADF